VLWTKTIGGIQDDVGYSLQPTADGGYVIAGYTRSYGVGMRDMYLVKTDSLGNVAVEEPLSNTPRTSVLSLTCEPNPCRGATLISITSRASSSPPMSLRVYDSQGRLVHSSFGARSSAFPLDLHSQPAGAYFIRCDVAGDHASTRVVLQR
jgi:hypothetical protein